MPLTGQPLTEECDERRRLTRPADFVEFRPEPLRWSGVPGDRRSGRRRRRERRIGGRGRPGLRLAVAAAEARFVWLAKGTPGRTGRGGRERRGVGLVDRGCRAGPRSSCGRGSSVTGCTRPAAATTTVPSSQDACPRCGSIDSGDLFERDRFGWPAAAWRQGTHVGQSPARTQLTRTRECAQRLSLSRGRSGFVARAPPPANRRRRSHHCDTDEYTDRPHRGDPADNSPQRAPLRSRRPPRPVSSRMDDREPDDPTAPRPGTPRPAPPVSTPMDDLEEFVERLGSGEGDDRLPGRGPQAGRGSSRGGRPEARGGVRRLSSGRRRAGACVRGRGRLPGRRGRQPGLLGGGQPGRPGRGPGPEDRHAPVAGRALRAPLGRPPLFCLRCPASTAGPGRRARAIRWSACWRTC